MMKAATVLMTALALGLAMPARAASDIQRASQATQPVRTSLPDEVVTVEASRPNPVGTIVGSAVGGAVLGAAVGGGVAAYRRYGNGNDGTWGNWQRDVAIGAGIGLGVGLIVGGISAASQAGDSHPARVAATEVHDVGFSAPMSSFGGRF